MLPNRFLYFKTLNAFNNAKSNIKQDSICFIEESKQIYTHNTFYIPTEEELLTYSKDKVTWGGIQYYW